jgi:N-sulfoglucosamine sulfohydrolase
MNFLLITADDMNWDAVGVFGCPTPGTTPNIDRLAAGGLRFNHGHVTIAVCQPSRSALMTGRYPHRSGGEGFYHLRHEGVPILPGILKAAGYSVGILGKLGHSTPYADFEWNMAYDQPQLGMGRNPEIYYRYARTFVQSAVDGGKPFFLMANSHDPHRPFFGNDREEWYSQSEPPAVPPSRTFGPDEVVVPEFLPDIPDVRLEISEYYNSVRRCDDTVGRLLDLLDETGTMEDTLVLFLSDNAMAFPFAKTNCYLNSTRTPLLASWPGVIPSGRVDDEHFASGIDFMPTILDVAGIEAPEGMDGQTFLPVLKGNKQKGRKHVFTQFHQTSARRNFPMRCVQDRRFGYIFNPWSDGEREFRNESQAGRSWTAMALAAKNDPDIAARNRLFSYRVLEEFYDFDKDPNALNNLIDDPTYANEIEALREALELWMAGVDDVALDAFVNRGSRRALINMMTQVDLEIGAAQDPGH